MSNVSDTKTEHKNRAVFLDRDGTINEEMGYINDISRFIIFEFVTEAIKVLNNAGYLVIVVTNQSGVARGYFTEALVQKVHQHLQETVESASARIDRIYYCPHHPIEGKGKYKKVCSCRKPGTGMISMAQKEFNIDLTKSYMIGDRYKDVLFAKTAGLCPIMVKTGYGLGELEHQRTSWKTQPHFIAQNLLEAAVFIRNHTID